MVKAGAMKKRYIQFKYEGPAMPADEIKRGIYNEAMKFFGELGISYAGLKLLEFDEREFLEQNAHTWKKSLDSWLWLVQLIPNLQGSNH